MARSRPTARPAGSPKTAGPAPSAGSAVSTGVAAAGVAPSAGSVDPPVGKAAGQRSAGTWLCCIPCRLPLCLVVLLAAVLYHLVRDRYVGVESLEALPDPALHLLRRLNLTERVERLLHDLNETRERLRMPGHQLKGELSARHPTVLIPGIVSCGLEVWQAAPCLGDNYFRERIWGGLSMARAVVRNISCWLDHLALDPVSGLDPPGKDVRVVEGIPGADYFVPGYWIWAKFIENAAAIGYHPGNLVLACYDWRLPFKTLERRDGYFSWLRRTIERLVHNSGHRAVVVGHSMGAPVWTYFMQWVTREAGPGWVDEYIHAFVPLGGALLGAAGPLGAVLSGEMQSTAALGYFNKFLDSPSMWVLNRTRIRDFFRTLGSMGALLPKGGSAVWGSAKRPTDIEADMVNLDGKSYNMEDLIAHLQGEPLSNYTFIADDFHGVRVPRQPGDTGGPGLGLGAASSQAISSNPLASALPIAPRMKIFCLYGTGIPTERAYRYRSIADTVNETFSRHFGLIDYLFFQAGNETSDNPSDILSANYESGVATSDGDGTVPLLSLGYMCAGGWRDFVDFNPGQSPVWIREYPDQSTTVWEDPRGGPGTSRHVEILGNSEVIRDLLRIMSGHEESLQEDRIKSNILAIAKRVTGNIRRELARVEGGDKRQ